MKIFKRDDQRISFSLLFSIAVHFALLLLGVWKIPNDNLPLRKTVSTNDEIKNSIKLDSIKFVSPEKVRAIKELRNRQIVANETNGKNEKPVDSRFLGEKDQTFDRQIIARQNGNFKEAGFGKKNGSDRSLAHQIDSTSKQTTSKINKRSKKELSLSDLGSFKMADIEKNEKETSESFEALTKKLADQSKVEALGIEIGKKGQNGLAQNNDFIVDVPLGDMTNLNTTEFKYYGFYHRIRQKLEQHWGSSIKDKAKNLYRSGRRMPASENLITSVTVTLDDRGQIIDMQIEGTSGVRELDQAAIESFNKAGPFPNPPKGLLVGGRATIQWGFVVKS